MKLQQNKNWPPNNERILPDCDACEFFRTIPLSYPSGKCAKYHFFCGLGYHCEDFTERK